MRLRTQALVKAFKGRTVVNEVSLDITSGKAIGLLGPNGAGKTTTFYMVVGLIRPDAGSVWLDEHDLAQRPIFERARLGLGYLPQDPSVFRKLSVEENLFVVLDNLKISRKEKRARAERALADLGISHLAKNRALTLSGGERRRLEISRALILEPKFLLLDEPYAGIDPLAVQEIQGIIRGLRERGIGVIITDHNVRETLTTCDEAYLIKEGKIWVHGTPQEIVNNESARKFYLGRELQALGNLMAIGLKQTMNMSQQLVMTPQLQQAIKLLQLSRMELENLINTELVDNPTLEESADSESTVQSMEEMDPTKQTKAEENPQASEDFNWESYLENFRSTPNLPVYRGGDDDLPSYENTLTQPANLTDHLFWQLKLSDMTEKQKAIGEVIIGNVNEDGYLQTSIEEIAQKESFDHHEVEAVLYHIQEFDPIGVAARDLKECLLVQIYDLKENDEMLELMVENHLPDLEKKNYQAISKTLGLSLDEIIERVKIIEELEPKPGRAFGGSPAHYIIPDIYVIKRGEEYAVMLNEDGLPKLKISPFYKNLLEEKAEAQGSTKEYVQGKLRSAVWLIRSIHQRQRTIYKVTESIVRQQIDFFEKGIAFLKPMVLRDVANDIGMHESTISRVTTNKYVHTPRGIFELKFFFNSGISRVHGADVASESVKEKVKTIIASENTGHPYSDQKIVELLLKENINIARRTVAKYREMLGILPSSKRKKVF